jgi:two-component system chemotaxis response regulator CheY
MKILVVDDSSTMRRIIKNTLARIGYEDVEEAENGVDALSKLEGIGLVLTDWNMPVMDGLTLVNSIRGNDKHKTVPIIMVTTEAAKEEIVVAIKAGVNDYIIKPFNQTTLQEKLDKVLGG